MPDPLSIEQRAIVLAILERYADNIDRVDMIGSRARGTHRPGSDLDLVVHGRLDAAMLTRLAVAFDESDLSIAVDLHDGNDLSTRLAAEAGRDAIVLATHESLVRAGS